MKNRMREIRTSGSVRGEEGNLLPYSTATRWDGAWGMGARGILPSAFAPGASGLPRPIVRNKPK